MKKDTVNEPFLVASVQQGPSPSRNSHKTGIVAVGIVVLIIVLIILIIFSALPITVLIIGTHYRDSSYCPIEPRISLFLIVHGSVVLSLIILMILIIVMVICTLTKHSMAAALLIVVLNILFYIILIFSIVWLIIGSVWTFRVYNRVIHEYDTVDNVPTFYCHPVLYKFTFIYLIVSSVLVVLKCFFKCLSSLLGESE
jgi:hypothetical protein